MTILDLTPFLALLLVYVGSLAGGCTWLLGVVKGERLARERAVDTLHGRIDKVKDNYVRRDDLDRRLAHIDDTLAKLDRRLDQWRLVPRGAASGDKET